jgi:hypothetical protein
MQKEILVKRCSAEDAADRMETLIESERFQEYAERAGINDLTRPLLMAYLLRQQWIIKPEDGATATSAMYQVLVRRWRLADGLPRPARRVDPAMARESHAPEAAGALSTQAARLLGFSEEGTMQKLLNCLPSPWLQTYVDTMYWLRAKREEGRAPRATVIEQFSRNWLTILISWALIAGAAMLHHVTNPHMVFIPFYLIPCAMLTLTINRRWGLTGALTSAIAGPLVQWYGDADYAATGVMLWNSLMRFLLYAAFIFLMDRVRIEVSAARRHAGKI